LENAGDSERDGACALYTDTKAAVIRPLPDTPLDRLQASSELLEPNFGGFAMNTIG